MKDLARIYIKAGNGGDGSVHFLHGKYQPKGGPDGGDGGAGGDIILVADENMPNLVEFNFKKKFIVKNADHGWGKNMHGKDTDDMEVKVPVGTMIYEISQEYSEANLRDRESLEKVMTERRLMVDMTKHGQRFEAAWGGRGGRGNFQFRSATNQTPREFEEGKPGDEKWLLLEMKVVADVGIVGLPNVGKSSILKALTNAHPKIAGYPFTTLEPNLGVLSLNRGDLVKNIVIVDVPGVVEDAWEGKGIGPWFLRHLERTNTLLHVLAPNVESGEKLTMSSLTKQLIHDYKIVRKELEKYGKGLPEKKEIVVVNKMELVEEKMRVKIEAKFKKDTDKDLIWVSAGMGEVGAVVEKLS
ncbi:MAG: GTPase ObgE [bacterium]